MRLQAVEQDMIDDRYKGVPGGVEAFPLSRIGEQGWNVVREDLPLPLAVLKRSALEHNSRWMRGFLEGSGASIAPHGKTTMSPQLFRMQLDDGAWAITLASVSQLQVARAFGVSRVLLANQLVGRRAIRYVLDELHRDPNFQFLCLVDSVEGVRLLDEAVQGHPVERPLEVLLECGFQGGRTGCRDLDSARQVARAVKAAEPRLLLRGVEGFEGLIPGSSPDEVERRVSRFLGFLVAAAAALEEEGLFAPGEIILSAGGSAFYDMVVERFDRAEIGRDFQVVIRSGCYLTQDHRMYRDAFERMQARSPELAAQGEGLRPALEVWSYVQSRPEPSRAILTLGKRDCGFDAGNPLPQAWYRPGQGGPPRRLEPEHRIVALNDQHAFLELPADSPLRVGDLVASGVSHPCTTFDKWQLLFLVDDAYDVVGAVRTFF